MKDSDFTFLVFPHQLFKNSEALNASNVLIIEDRLFFKQYNFHKQKLLLHRASMKFYENYLQNKGINVSYIEHLETTVTEKISDELKKLGSSTVKFYELHDNWLHKKLIRSLSDSNIKYQILKTPQFLTDINEAKKFFAQKNSYFFTSFYIHQRKKLNILIEDDLPVGGKWTFDSENRKKLPKNLTIPKPLKIAENKYVKDAKSYIEKHFPANPGSLSNFNYATTFDEAENILADFLDYRFCLFGDYEDAITEVSQTNFHSVLTPVLNIGLITPKDIVSKTLLFSENNEINLNSLEGFLRQIIGWREYIRIVYENLGTKQRNSNYWGHTRKIPPSFYDGSTGISPIDKTIHNLISKSYSHHIERLMILGNFMLLSRFDPNDIYKWFMELYIDAYDWVMVPNVYGMSQFADGGLTTTKPYISSSNYVLKMSDYKKGDWCKVWDALYWEFISDNLEFFSKNQRTMMMVSQFKKLNPERKAELSRIAKDYLR